MSGEGRHVYGYDVYARRTERGHLADGSGTGKAEAPQRFNIASMSFDPEQIYQEIKKHMPDFEMAYEIDPLKQAIADSWPDSLDDSCAREEWDWMPQYDLESMTVDMLEKLRAKLNK